jgi:hypothetical protein
VRGGFGAVVFGASLAEEPLLLFEEHLFTAQLGETTRKVRVTLYVELAQLASSHPMKMERVAVEALGHSRGRQVGERTECVQPESLTRGR